MSSFDDMFPIPPLYIAANCGNLVAVRTLLESGANIDQIATGWHEFTALTCAIRGRQKEVAQFLVEKGASIEGFAIRSTNVHEILYLGSLFEF